MTSADTRKKWWKEVVAYIITMEDIERDAPSRAEQNKLNREKYEWLQQRYRLTKRKTL